ncbi:MAG TPA: DPP IV N-terminal domain-containing protein [Verrucomicrobiae bacterium]|nr:DPP IV N-terminal domain-containing protein [Verrucomicrobiae bacterium]
MKIAQKTFARLAAAAVAFCVLGNMAFAQTSTDSPQQRRRFSRQERGVYKARITPHWFTNNTEFWYRNDLRDGAKEFILVDAEKGTREPAFDHAKLAAALSKASGQDFKADKLPFSDIEFVDDGKAIQFDAADKKWKCDLVSYKCTALTSSSETKQSSQLAPPLSVETAQLADARLSAPLSEPYDPEPYDSEETPDTTHLSPQQTNPRPQGQRQGFRRRGGFNRDVRSPDEKWTAFVKDNNVFVRAGSDGQEIQLSTDGEEGNSYSRLEWSPDSQSLIAWRVEPGDIGMVYLIESSPPGGGRAIMRERPYAQAGDKFPKYEVNIFNVASRKQIKPKVDRFEHEYETPRLHWELDHRHFAYEQEDRGHQRLRVIEVNCDDGSIRNLVDERTKTFIWTAHTENLGVNLVNWLTNSDEMIYVSERDGWRHLYLVDARKGGIVNQITKGEWVIRGIDKIDEDARQIWFRAGGMNPDQDPYFVHYYRINFDGTGLVALTKGNGNHTVQFSPDWKYLIDTYSRVDMAPVHELRRCSDGKLVCKLEEADISELKASGWEPPEVFVAKGRDGKTDIWGLIYRPKNLDPSKKYPILETIYNGPQGAYVPKSFSGSTRRSDPYTEAGFILVQSDAMGTAFRSKAFHDVCWHNLKDAGFPDRIKWIKAAAAKYPYMDLTRVGIFGTSAGGQNAAAAVLFHSDFYKCAVANSGCHDNRLDKASWNEQWMGYMPKDKIWSHDPDNWYSQNSNIDNAAKLGGKLFLIVGEMDDNVPPESTYRFVDALIKARKDFDLLVVPGANHGAASPITQRRTLDFFVHNLLGKEPPNRNAMSVAGENEN